MALTPLAAGEVGAVVTFLAMDARPELGPERASPLRLSAKADITPDAYRALFRAVGGPWLWYSRLAMDEAALRAAIGDLWVVEDQAGAVAGMLELDFHRPGVGLIQFLGLVPGLAGRGHGRWLMEEALRRAWRPDVTRVEVHTCSLDHPAALPAYLRAGFTATRRAFESFPDPRRAGLLPARIAPQVPLIS